METPAKKAKIDSSTDTNCSPTVYKNIHCSQSCMKLYLQEETADVHFLFQTGNEEKKLPAHKFILGIGSPVFHSMFYGSLQEKGDIRIVDATIDAFKEFLQFFYLDSVKIEMRYLDELMYLANKYDIPECFNICETFSKEKLPIEHICHVLEMAVTFGRSKLITFLLAKISEKPTQIFTSNSFKNCSWNILKMILESGNLDCDEKEVFDACMVWSENSCIKNNIDPLEMKNRRDKLGDCFRLIQFSIMHPLNIYQCLSKYKDLFKREELIEIIRILSSDNSIKFKASNRKIASSNIYKWNDNAVLLFSRCYPSGDGCSYISKAEVTTLATNKKLLLGAVGTPPINPRTRDKPELSATLKIVDCTSNQKTLLEQRINLVLGGKFEPRNIVKLSQPVAFEPMKVYEIQIEFGTSWAPEVYDTKKAHVSQVRSFGDCKVQFGKVNGSGNGIISHLYFN